jgi:hypothetical protein
LVESIEGAQEGSIMCSREATSQGTNFFYLMCMCVRVCVQLGDKINKLNKYYN